jgi:ubiquitin-conjugating enzyme E2 D/E
VKLEKSPPPFVKSIKSPGNNNNNDGSGADDLFTWDVALQGPPDSPYAGGTFVLRLEFPAEYPFKQPKLAFTTKVYHPSVLQETGEICGAVLGSWGPTLTAEHCLHVTYSLLQSPSADHPLEETIAQQLATKPKEFEKMAKKYTKDYAK